jgi:hypothetical protein
MAPKSGGETGNFTRVAEDQGMKHVRSITHGAPGKAEAWQEFVCSLNQFFADALSFKGGSSPFVGLVEDKCDLPEAT